MTPAHTSHSGSIVCTMERVAELPMNESQLQRLTDARQAIKQVSLELVAAGLEAPGVADLSKAEGILFDRIYSERQRARTIAGNG